MYNTDSTSQVAQIKGITGLNVRCSAVEDESSRSTSPWGLWVVKLVRFLYIPVSRLYTAYRWLARSQWTCVNWGTNTIKNHKKVTDRSKDPLKNEWWFYVDLMLKFSSFKTLTFNTYSSSEQRFGMMYIATMLASFQLCCQNHTVGNLFI